MLRAASEGLPLPGALVLFSPWAVLKFGDADSHNTLRCADPLLVRANLEAAARAYAGVSSNSSNSSSGSAATGSPPRPPPAPLSSPLLSPALSGDFGAARRAAAGGRFPPTIVFAGTRELLLSDAVMLHRRMAQGGVPAELVVAEGMWHDWPLVAPGTMALPEAAAAIERAAAFARRHVAVAPSTTKILG